MKRSLLFAVAIVLCASSNCQVRGSGLAVNPALVASEGGAPSANLGASAGEDAPGAPAAGGAGPLDSAQGGGQTSAAPDAPAAGGAIASGGIESLGAGGMAAPDLGGTEGDGRSSSTGGLADSGGATSVGGSDSSGGTSGAGGATDSGGNTEAGGATADGGAIGTGGATGSGGTMGADGATSAGGTPSTGAATGAGGLGGTSSAGGTAGAGGTTGSGGTTTSATGGVPSTGGATLKLVFSDEFNGPANSGADTTKWTYSTSPQGNANGDQEKYTTRTANVFQDGQGHLTLRALRDYTSGRLETSGKANFQSGRFEIRAILPAGAGSFPGIVLLGTVGSWPQCGEISIMEQGQDKTSFDAGAQAGGASGDIGYVTYAFSPTDEPSSTFHVYSVDWYPDHLSFQFDGNEFARSTFNTTSPFYRIPEYLVLSLALGGTQGGTIDNAAFPMDLVLDYVRVYSF